MVHLNARGLVGKNLEIFIRGTAVLVVFGIAVQSTGNLYKP